MLELKSIHKNYKNQNILKNINLTINDGDFVTIMGSSGGGKSTLLYILSLLEAPTIGKIFFDNKEVNFKKEKNLENIRHDNIGLVFQNSNLIPGLSDRLPTILAVILFIFLFFAFTQSRIAYISNIKKHVSKIAHGDLSCCI